MENGSHFTKLSGWVITKYPLKQKRNETIVELDWK
ncbi:hypothetical protein EFD32_pA0012 (plasmid) [Enterococcus faecalis D32]|nr:hypothetical protein EFD32_pA0012 [Enterococcus faecalis D32]